MRYGLPIILLFLFLWMISGCATQMEQPALEDVGLIGVMGFDYVDENKMKVTVSVPQPAQDAEEKTEIYSVTVNLVHESIMKLSTESERTLSAAQLRVVLFSEKFATKHGIEQIIKHLYRDSVVGDKVFVAVVKGSVEELMTAKYPDKPRIGVYLNGLLHPHMGIAFSPFTTIHDYIFHLSDGVSDPITPYLEKKNSNVKVSKVALFKRGKMVGTMSPEEAKLVSALHFNKDLANIKLKIKEKEMKKPTWILLHFVKNTSKIESNGNLDNPEFNVEISLTANVQEYTGTEDLEKDVHVNGVETAINEVIKKDMEKLLKKFQKIGVDPIRLGEAMRSHIGKSEWSKEVWMDTFPRAQFDIKVQTEIKSTGTLE